jgi:hypothetical protein
VPHIMAKDLEIKGIKGIRGIKATPINHMEVINKGSKDIKLTRAIRGMNLIKVTGEDIQEDGILANKDLNNNNLLLNIINSLHRPEIHLLEIHMVNPLKDTKMPLQ